MWEKVVLNLLSNAFKFTFDGEIEVSLRLVGKAVRLTVRDTGTGIPAEEVPRLFERFHRVKNARGRSFEGSGIGLALVKELVRLHGGEVSVESEVGSGSAFVVTVPLGSAHLPADRIEAARNQTPTGVRPEAFVEEALRWLPDEKAKVATDFTDTLQSKRSADVGVSTRTEDDLAGSHVLVADDNGDMREYIRRLLDRLRRRGRGGRRGSPPVGPRAPARPGADRRHDAGGRRVRAHARAPCRPELERRAGDPPLGPGRGGVPDRGARGGGGRVPREAIQRSRAFGVRSAQLRLAESRRRSREALRASEERHRALVTASSDVVYRMSADWTVMHPLDGRNLVASNSHPDPRMDGEEPP